MDAAAGTARAADGALLAYRVRGNGRRALVFLHGWGATGDYFAETVAALDPAEFRAVTLDLRGHGDSGGAGGDPTLDLLAADVVAVADVAGISEFVAVGHSMGGKLAQYLALVRPERVAGLVLFASAPAAALPTPPFVRAWVELAGDGDAMVREVVVPHVERPLPGRVLRRLARSWESIDRATLVRTLALVEASFAERLKGLDVPALVVGGAHDRLHSRDADAVRASLSGARLELLDAGSELPVEVPEQVVRVVSEFARRVRAGADAPVRG